MAAQTWAFPVSESGCQEKSLQVGARGGNLDEKEQGHAKVKKKGGGFLMQAAKKKAGRGDACNKKHDSQLMQKMKRETQGH